jgi:hypothetical protein
MVKVRDDEFCLKCMEWREYDAKGRCTVCGSLIKKERQAPTPGYGEYEREDVDIEQEEE